MSDPDIFAHTQDLCSDLSQFRAFTKNMQHISYIRRPLVSSSCAADTADRYARSGASSTTRNNACPTYQYAEYTRRLVLSKHNWLIPSLCCFPFSQLRFSVWRQWKEFQTSESGPYTLFHQPMYGSNLLQAVFVLLVARIVVRARLSVQIICSFTSLFWRGFNPTLLYQFPSFLNQGFGLLFRLLLFIVCLLSALSIIDLAFVVPSSTVAMNPAFTKVGE